jgi:putative alpha-1,2-mannosidase
VRRHRRWAWGSREGKKGGEVVAAAAAAAAAVAAVEAEAGQEVAAAARRAAQKRWNPELRRLRLKTAGVAGPPPSLER